MSKSAPRFVHNFKDTWEDHIDRMRLSIVDGYWHLKKNKHKFLSKEEDFKHTQKSTEEVLEALQIFLKLAEGERDKPGVQPQINKMVDIINIHLKRIKNYYEDHSVKSFQKKEDQKKESQLQRLVFKGERLIKDKIKDLNIENDMSHLEIEFFDEAIATIPMKKVLCMRDPKIATLIESLEIDWDLIIDNGLFINMDKKDIPDYNYEKHFWEQELDSLQFWVSEYNKICKGYTIDGYHMSPFLYFHINFFKTPIKNHNNEIMTPPLRDNEWYVDEIKKYAEKKAKELERAGVIIYGTRRFAKTTSEASYIHQGIVANGTETGTVTSSNAKDLKSIVDKLKKSLDYIVPAFRININSGKDWDEEVIFGLKSKSGRQFYEHFILAVTNTDSGSKKGSQKTAGGNPLVYVSDEIGKSEFIKSHEAAIPSFESDNGWVCIPLYTGCLTAGNKVFNKKGNLVNIEDLTKEQGILGYDVNNFNNSYEDILHINPPQNKECYKINTNKGTTIECSFDHPFYVKYRNKTTRIKGTKKSKRKTEFVKAKDITKDMYLSFPDIIPLKGKEKMQEPYFIGAIIGDGNYSGDRGLRFYNEDQEIWDYIDSLNKDYIIFNSYITSKNRLYREARFRGEMKFLKDLGIYGQSKENKDLPKNIHLYREEDITEFIAGLYDTDGMIYATSKAARIEMCQLSEKIIDSLKLLLIRLGIHSNKYKIEPDGREREIKSKSPYYKLVIQDKKSCEIFAEKIPLKIKRKKDKLVVLKNFYKGKKCSLDKYRPNMRFERVISVEKVGIKPVYNLTTSDTHTYLANGAITHNTGGEEDLSADAEKVLSNPTNYGFLEMDWNILEYGIPKEAITWERRKFGWFIPAQMSTYTGMRKIETNFADFLEIDSDELRKIKFWKTDWVHNSKKIKEIRSKLSGGALLSEKVFRPIDPEECFLSAKRNPFPANGIKRHKEKLQSEGDRVFGTARRIGLERDKNDPSKVTYFLDTKKEVNEYPHDGSFTDCPFLLYDDFPEERPADPYRYVAGLDDYKQDESNPSKQGSIGAFYIFDRLKRKIVLGLANRPDPHTDFHKQMHMALDAWNAKCFVENEDMDFKKYLDRLPLTGPDMYLYKGFDAYDDFSKFKNGKRKFGWSPRPDTVKIVRGYCIDYTKDNVDYLDDNGNVTHTVSGYERIEDIQLLQEMVKYKPEGNFDRLVAFGSCLAIDYYLTCNYITPKSFSNKKEEPQKNYNLKSRNKFFTKTRRSPFSR